MPQQQTTPIEEGEIDSDSHQDPSMLEVPAVNWAKYLGVKSVQYKKMGRTTAEEPNDWDLGNAVQESEKIFSTDLQVLMTETTNDTTLLKTLVCLERQQLGNIPEEYLPSKRKLYTRYGLVFYEDRIIVPKNLRTTVISLLHKGHPAIKKMSMAAKHFWWPRIAEAIQKKCDGCILCKMSGKDIKPNLHRTEKKQLPALSKPNEEIQLDFVGPITEKNQRFYILLQCTGIVIGRQQDFVRRQMVKLRLELKFMEQYTNLNFNPKTTRTAK